MKTRSQTKNQNQQQNLYNESESTDSTLEIPLEIDFDEASREWLANKVKTAVGTYKYVCQKSNMNGSPCKKKCIHGSDYCKTHVKMMRKLELQHNE